MRMSQTKTWRQTILLCVVSFGIVLLGQYVSQVHGVDHEYQKPPLYDVIHTYLPDLSNYYWMNWILLAVVVLRFISLKQNFQDYLSLTCMAMVIRAFTLMVTSQPSCIPSCQTNPGNWFLSNCWDFNYSGHEVCIAVACICIIKDTDSSRFEKLFWAVYIPLCALWIAMSRQHYTADVMLSMVIAFLMCYLRFLENNIKHILSTN